MALRHALNRFWRFGALTALAITSATSAVSWAQEPASVSVFDPLNRPAPTTQRGATSFLLSVTTAGKRLVTAGERGIVLTSDNNGAQWTQSSAPVSVLLTAVKFATPEKGWAVGHSGVVLHTNDGGKTWQKQLDGKQSAQAVLEWAKKATEGKPDDAQSKRALMLAERLVADGADKPFFDIYAENENVAIIIGAFGGMFRTDDGGKTWQPWHARMNNPLGAHLYSIQTANDAIFIAGEQGVLYVSRDGANSFTEIKSPYNGSFFGMLALSDKKIIAFGLRGNCFWSIDGGQTWQPSEVGTSASITGGMVDADGSVILVTQAGEVLRSRDEGHTFKSVPVLASFPYSSVARAGDGSLVLVGVRGVSRIPAPVNAAP